MPWPIPNPGDIASRAASVYEGNADLEGIDARSPNTIASTVCRIVELATTDLYLNLADIADEMMPDSAVDNLARLASIWGVPRLPAQAAAGNGLMVANSGGSVVVTAGVLAVNPNSGVTIEVTTTSTIAASSTLAVPFVATTTGAATNQNAGAVFNLVSPIAGLATQTATLDSSGLTGGADIEFIERWRGRILLKIRQPPAGGDVSDYETWALDAGEFVAYVDCIANYAGLGTVGVIIAGPGPRVATPTETAEVLALLTDGNHAPVGISEVIVASATLEPVNFTLHLIPDSAANRTAAHNALALQVLGDGLIGQTLYMSRCDEAVSTGGEYAFERTAPTADVSVGITQIPTLGTVSFV